MRTESIERYLRTRRLRYFRGHHDAEFFFLLTVGHEQLHVHLEVSQADREMFTVRVTPAYFFPAADRARLGRLTDTWNLKGRRAKAVVHESTDPERIGVAAENSYSIADGTPFEDFADLTDKTIRSAVKLFAEITPCEHWLRVAG